MSTSVRGDDTLTREMTARAQQEVARDFATWLRDAGGVELAKWNTRTAKCYITERALAGFVARTAAALGDYVARGALITFAGGLSDYIDRDTFELECCDALRARGV